MSYDPHIICLCFSGNKLWSHLDVTVMASRTKHNVTADATVEVQHHLSEPNIGRTDDPLLYWERHKCIYPNLYKLAIVYLCTPASSVPCERLFSKAGEVISKKSSNLLGRLLGSEDGGLLCVIQYTRPELLNLRSISHSDLGPSTSLLEEKLRDLNISSHSTPWLEAKKGRHSGTFARFRRRPYRPPLPALLLSNVRSLRHKMDELQLMIQTNKDYSDCSAICLTETWLDPSVPDQVVTLPGFTLHRADRSFKLSRKAKGGGVCIMINERWCTNSTELTHVCSPHLEYLTVKCRPSFLPREFASIILICIYIPPEANANTTIAELANYVSSVENSHPDTAIIVLGDFNQTNLSSELPGYHQQVTCPSRGINTLDHCYTTIQEAYRSFPRAPLGRSDHAMLLLIPQYRQKVKSSKSPTKLVWFWSPEAIEQLEGCFACTDWDVFDAAGDIDDVTDAVTSYVNYCVDLCIPLKKAKHYNNNKPWFNKDIK
ncbi:hypothetical protein N1851_025938 [Merluccius polli]|uniref:HAT C-terminal dimerisation domain-containing protein n=1 Tax=Merluccius polli TaxID=89951 RepID=A0AA47NTF3_MERPO|nr:hypothetical protein N1851_025938 [Merluccius polli]